MTGPPARCALGELLDSGAASWTEEPEPCDGPPAYVLLGPIAEDTPSLLCGAHARRMIRRRALPADYILASLT